MFNCTCEQHLYFPAKIERAAEQSNGVRLEWSQAGDEFKGGAWTGAGSEQQSLLVHDSSFPKSMIFLEKNIQWSTAKGDPTNVSHLVSRLPGKFRFQENKLKCQR